MLKINDCNVAKILIPVNYTSIYDIILLIKRKVLNIIT